MTEGGNQGLVIAGEVQGGQELPICSCTILNVAPLHIQSSINLSCAFCHKLCHTAPFAHKTFPSISCKAFPQMSTLVIPAGSSHFTVATPPGHLADIQICWNGTCDETHQCLKQLYCPCHHLPAPSMECSLAPNKAGECWPLSFLHCHGFHVDYCTGAGKLLGSLMSWGRDGGLSIDSNAPTVEIT